MSGTRRVCLVSASFVRVYESSLSSFFQVTCGDCGLFFSSDHVQSARNGSLRPTAAPQPQLLCLFRTIFLRVHQPHPPSSH